MIQSVTMLLIALSCGGCFNYRGPILGGVRLDEQVEKIETELPGDRSFVQCIYYLSHLSDGWENLAPNRWHGWGVMRFDREANEIRVPYSPGWLIAGGPEIYMAPRLNVGPPPIGELTVRFLDDGTVTTSRRSKGRARPDRWKKPFVDLGLLDQDQLPYRCKMTLVREGRARFSRWGIPEEFCVLIIDTEGDKQRDLVVRLDGEVMEEGARYVAQGPYRHDLAGMYLGPREVRYVPEKEVDYWVSVSLDGREKPTIEFELVEAAP